MTGCIIMRFWKLKMTHELKVWSEYFHLIRDRKKEFEIRKNDRGFRVGDSLLLKEWNPKTQKYTGRYIIRKITYMIQGKFGLPEDICVMQLR